jgi:hypothetical protein
VALRVVGLAPELPLGQVALAEPAVVDRMGTVDAAHLEGVGGELEEHSPGNVSCLGCNGSSSATRSYTSAPEAIPRSTIWRAATRSSSVGRGERAKSANLPPELLTAGCPSVEC